jgi:hypothetical protein
MTEIVDIWWASFCFPVPAWCIATLGVEIEAHTIRLFGTVCRCQLQILVCASTSTIVDPDTWSAAIRSTFPAPRYVYGTPRSSRIQEVNQYQGAGKLENVADFQYAHR